MAKVTVYVPDDLWQRAQTQSEHEQVNLSQIFQKALTAEIRQAARFQEQADLDARLDLAALRDRFAGQRRELYRYGYEAGINYAQRHLSYPEIRFCESVNWDVDVVIRRLMRDGDEVADLLLEAVLDHVGYVGDPFAPAAADGVQIEVAEGFVAALRRAWDLVVAELPDVEQPGQSSITEEWKQMRQKRQTAPERATSEPKLPAANDQDGEESEFGRE